MVSIASSAVRSPAHYERLDDVESRYLMKNRVGYNITHARSRNAVDIVEKELWTPTAPFDRDTMPLLDLMRPSVHAIRFHDTKQMKLLP